ncbi:MULTISPECIES: hypothetical protein [Bacteroidales]|jgi:hypothetical protein|uniref:hypothetical protein n=1 Tax=Bacteroidales TaxID=171549 RepID=UPI0005752E5E|nr:MULTISPECIES: hypothetical protein [Bacteroidales]KHM46839.1 hypothetical protein PU94_09210 [Coprobacter secundus]
MKKRNIITIILLIYLGIMAYIGWPNYIDEGRYWEYAGIIAGTLVAIFALRYVQGKKEKMRNYYKEESEKKTHNTDSKK